MDLRYCSKCFREFPLNDQCFDWMYQRDGTKKLSTKCRSCRVRAKIEREDTLPPPHKPLHPEQYQLENPPPAMDRFRPCPPKIKVPEQKGLAHVLFNVWRNDDDETIPTTGDS